MAAEVETGNASAQSAPVTTQAGGSPKRLAILTSAHAMTHMRGGVLPLIYPLLMTSMGFGYVQLGAMLTVTRLVGGLLQGIWGSVSRYVPGKWLIFGEQVGMGIAIWFTGASQNYGELVGTITVGRVASSPHHPIAASMISRWYGKSRGTALSFHFAGANLATLLSPLAATALLLRWNWRVTLEVFGLPCLVIAALVAFGLPAEAVQPLRKKQRGATAAAPPAAGSGFLAPLRDPLVLRLVVTASVTAGGKGLGILQTLVPLLLIRGMGLSTTAAGLVFTCFTATSVVGPLICGRLSDRYPRTRFLSGLLVICTAAGVVMAFWAQLGLVTFIGVLVVFGLAVYSCSPVEQAIIGDLTSESLSAEAYSLFYGITFGCSAFWPLLLTVVLARWGFSATFLVVACTYLAGAIIYGTRDWGAAGRRSGATAEA